MAASNDAAPGRLEGLLMTGAETGRSGIEQDDDADDHQSDADGLAGGEGLAEEVARDELGEQDLDQREGADLGGAFEREGEEPALRGERAHEAGFHSPPGASGSVNTKCSDFVIVFVSFEAYGQGCCRFRRSAMATPPT